jgi:hypothetical protein
MTSNAFHDGAMCVSISKVVNGKPEVEKRPFNDIVHEQVKRVVEGNWLAELARKEAKNGKGGNKLRTYALFKKDFCFEPYLHLVSDWRKRSLLFKFRAGVAPLRIETGRFESNGSSTCGIPVESRKCNACLLGVEDEKHFLCSCPLYNSERDVLKNVCIEYNNKVASAPLSFRKIHKLIDLS